MPHLLLYPDALLAMPTSFSGCSYLVLQTNFDVFDKTGTPQYKSPFNRIKAVARIYIYIIIYVYNYIYKYILSLCTQTYQTPSHLDGWSSFLRPIVPKMNSPISHLLVNPFQNTEPRNSVQKSYDSDPSWWTSIHRWDFEWDFYRMLEESQGLCLKASNLAPITIYSIIIICSR